MVEKVFLSDEQIKHKKTMIGLIVLVMPFLALIIKLFIPEPYVMISAAIMIVGLSSFVIYVLIKTKIAQHKFDNKYRTRYIPKEVKKYVWERDQGRCVNCKSTENLQFDHIIPFSLGGANTKDNIQILCEKCNKQKGKNVDYC
ncbi:MAG: hypothetical protein GF364_08250 [Candidatus Lokiarchaeota archaeon]|nr:hypothetical protein [Candidatus Lokiarchaeota archaeon]